VAVCLSGFGASGFDFDVPDALYGRCVAIGTSSSG